MIYILLILIFLTQVFGLLMLYATKENTETTVADLEEWFPLLQETAKEPKQ